MVKKPGRAGEGAVSELGKKYVKTLARKEESLKELADKMPVKRKKQWRMISNG